MHVPRFAQFRIQESGKYLGWFLGLQSVELSFQEPRVKFVNRIEEICSGKAPAATCICRYNQRAASVFSYVAQFAPPPDCIKLPNLAHWAIHRILRMPPNSMSRKLSHSIGFFTAIDPIPLSAYCEAIRFRLAHSEKDYLNVLLADVTSRAGDRLFLDSPPATWSKYGIPDGGFAIPSILEFLLDAINLDGVYSVSKASWSALPEHDWICDYPNSTYPFCYKGVQSAAIQAFSVKEKVRDLSQELMAKLCVTLGKELADRILAPVVWFSSLECQLTKCPLFIRVCWLKAISGAWCTSRRLHTGANLPCVFGCDAADEFMHYIVCPVLWLFPGEHLSHREDSLAIEARLCLVEPSIAKLRALAFVHTLYHAVMHDPACFISDSELKPPRIVQSRASDMCRHVKHLCSESNFDHSSVDLPMTVG